ncbi:hypothetical protein GCM10009828_086510 [Actinoplanes couchii]|uniref:Uncharacterized protein n=1 Tax=Actinoplanes couchii TaxID=403638 RepID=A0ABQ3XET7_9ACTN|nr:hypothetical protein Aco03nite_054290 [Actinoplanes couchii]
MDPPREVASAGAAREEPGRQPTSPAAPTAADPNNILRRIAPPLPIIAPNRTVASQASRPADLALRSSPDAEKDRPP